MFYLPLPCLGSGTLASLYDKLPDRDDSSRGSMRNEKRVRPWLPDLLVEQGDHTLEETVRGYKVKA